MLTNPRTALFVAVYTRLRSKVIQKAFVKYEGAGGAESLGVGAQGAMVVGVEDPPGFDVGVGSFDEIAELGDTGVALVVAFRELLPDGFLHGVIAPTPW